MSKRKLTPKQIEDLYDKIPRITQERNDFILPQIVDFVSGRRWINPRPEYQRRLVWDNKKKSKLIESFLMNIPIPPIFLFEHKLSKYEVMDGQQRINAIMEFYENELKLQGLETWSALNGLTRKHCPEKIQHGLDRRRLSATVLLAESAQQKTNGKWNLRQQVFERLNTGGQTLNAQELRNSMYSGRFNELLIELAGNSLFNDIWGIPRYEEHYTRKGGQISSALAKNALFKRMTDCEIVLRFFAFRETSKIRGSVKLILNRCMESNKDISISDAKALKESFLQTLKTSHAIFGAQTFQVKNEWGKKYCSQPLSDAVMVSIYRLRKETAALKEARLKIRASLNEALNDDYNYEVIVGRPNTAAAIKERIEFLVQLLRAVL